MFVAEQIIFVSLTSSYYSILRFVIETIDQRYSVSLEWLYKATLFLFCPSASVVVVDVVGCSKDVVEHRGSSLPRARRASTLDSSVEYAYY